MNIHRTHIVTAIVCVVMLLTLSVGWFAFGQMSNTNTSPELTPGMETPLVKDVNLERDIENLMNRVSALEATVLRLENELNDLKTKSNKK